LLDAFPKLTADESLVLSGMALVLVPDLAQVDRIGEQVAQRAARKFLAAPGVAAPRYPGAGNDPALAQVVP
jgi:hypothetical protein